MSPTSTLTHGQLQWFTSTELSNQGKVAVIHNDLHLTIPKDLGPWCILVLQMGDFATLGIDDTIVQYSLWTKNQTHLDYFT